MYTFIWDLDGTLFNSYDVIARSLIETYRQFGIEADEAELRELVIRYSVSYYIHIMEERTGLAFSQMKEVYSGINESNKNDITLMENAAEILEYLDSKGCRNYVYTHRSRSAEPVLEKLGVRHYFGELVTGLNHFERKPDPEGLNYLIDKYSLDRASTFYVGDRSLDMECAENAGVGGILYLPDGNITEPVGTERLIVKDLMEIAGLLDEG